MLQQSAKGAGQVDYSEWEKTTEDAQDELRLLQRDVFRLARALDPKTEHSQHIGTVLRFVAMGTHQTLEVGIPQECTSQSFILSNVGEHILKNRGSFPREP